MFSLSACSDFKENQNKPPQNNNWVLNPITAVLWLGDRIKAAVNMMECM